ncbi:hypothetical protein CAP35_02505 [Chitinophagaceae bacterium IBVUCB1]|nr:hypothetical protein CAP35_02505 [Chitinophagaceae bacterium IBVUCB1]
MMRLAVVTTHPIQYNAPWFRLLAQTGKLDVRVFYTWEASKNNEKYDPGFKRVIGWDIPLLDGYDHVFVKNVASQQGSHHFKGIDNPTLIQEIKDWKAEAVLIIGWAYKSHLACLRYFKGKIPVLFRGDSTLLDEKAGLKKYLRRLALTYVYRHIDYALYVGENNKQYFKAHGIKTNQLVYAPHAIDNTRFIDTDGSYANEAYKLREKMGIAVDDFVVLFAGKLEEKKNPAFLMQLAAQLKGDKMRFVIVGNGELETSLKESAQNDNRIVFLDFQNQKIMPVIYNMADVFILPSIGPNETWGLALNEAMACGRPVIATNKVGGAIDLIKENGIIISPDEIGKAVSYITKLRTDKSFFTESKSASINRIQGFSFDVIVDNIIQLTDRIKQERK